MTFFTVRLPGVEQQGVALDFAGLIGRGVGRVIRLGRMPMFTKTIRAKKAGMFSFGRWGDIMSFDGTIIIDVLIKINVECMPQRVSKCAFEWFPFGCCRVVNLLAMQTLLKFGVVLEGNYQSNHGKRSC